MIDPPLRGIEMLVPETRRRSVWIVDDSALDAERARRALSRTYSVEVLNDGASALERLATGSRPPDVLVLDWMMPGVTGIEVCRFVRGSEDRTLKQLGVLMVTVHQRTEQVVEGLSAGANDFISKPYAEAELEARVAALVRQKELLERAERAEGALRHLFTSSPDALLGVDDEGRVTFVNLEAEIVLGVRDADARGHRVRALLPGLTDLSGDDDSEDGRRTRPDLAIGEELYAPVVRLAGPGGNATRVISLRNVTQQRKREAERLDFYSVIAHDLRSPLSSALMRTELILDGMHGPVVPGMSEDLHKLQRNLRELIAMINDFLDLARFEGGAHSTGDDRVDLVAVSRETVDDFRPLADASELRLAVETGATPVQVSGDRRRLKQVLSNLIANAIKFTPRGGSVNVTVTLEENDAVVRVRDTGRGIAKDAIPKLFERYSRAIDAEHEVAGTGLGLMIVRESVKAHGGSVGVESTEGRGSTFWFRLPVGHAEAPGVDHDHPA